MLDVAENQLFSLIGEKKFEAIRLYLSTHNSRYSNKLEIKGNIKQELTTAEKKLLKEALKRAELDND
jgi:LytS/YehU family sensor histidine kinase